MFRVPIDSRCSSIGFHTFASPCVDAEVTVAKVSGRRGAALLTLTCESTSPVWTEKDAKTQRRQTWPIWTSWSTYFFSSISHVCAALCVHPRPRRRVGWTLRRPEAGTKGRGWGGDGTEMFGDDFLSGCSPRPCARLHPTRARTAIVLKVIGYRAEHPKLRISCF